MSAIAHVALVVRDYDEARDWFVRALGFRVVADEPREEGKRWLLVAPAAGGTSLLLARAATDAQHARVGDQTGGRVGFFLHTDDFARDHALLARRGVRFVEAPREEAYGTVAVFLDLYGNRWDLIQPRARPPGGAAPARFEQRLVVEERHLDEQRHVNNVVYLQWVNDVAVAHWQAAASADARAAIAWVALRHEIDYLGAALLGDEILLRTWVGPADGLLFERNTEVRRVADDRVLARVRTRWCPVDATTGRPRRVPAEVRGQFSVEP